jgi:ribosomal protein L12E/L44/L45/RPP1/RPP2
VLFRSAAPAEAKEEKKAAAKPKVEEKKEEDLQGLGALFG